MFLSNLSIKRPIFATMMMLALVILGIFSYRKLAIDLMPDIEIPILSIVTVFPGASPETVEREVTKRIEEEVNRIPGAKHVTSVSRESVSQVVVEFQLEVKINEASQDARAKINTIRKELPQDIEEPIIQKMDIASLPVDLPGRAVGKTFSQRADHPGGKKDQTTVSKTSPASAR